MRYEEKFSTIANKDVYIYAHFITYQDNLSRKKLRLAGLNFIEPCKDYSSKF